MDYKEIRKTLEKQLVLLSERSEKSKGDVDAICKLTEQMVNLCRLLHV